MLNTLWLFNIAMGNGPFIDGLPIKTGDFPWLNKQMVIQTFSTNVGPPSYKLVSKPR